MEHRHPRGLTTREGSRVENSPAEIADAYDGLAIAYEGLVSEDLWMRRVLWKRFNRAFSAKDRVLDVACGTGLDTLFLARKGVRMSAIDVSPLMIAELRQKATLQALSDRIEVRVHDAGSPFPWQAGEFDGIVSAFSGLNTIPDLPRFSAETSRILRPHGRMIVHLLSPGGIWSRLSLQASLRWGAARNRKLRQGFHKTIAGREVLHYVRHAPELYHENFRHHFCLRRAYALGFLWPQGVGSWLPARAADLGGSIEWRLGSRSPFLKWGRFLVLELEKRNPRNAG